MANITNNNFNNIDLKVSKSDYWDFILSKESDPTIIYDGTEFYYDKLISLIDIDNSNCCINDSILYSLSGYTWDDAINSGLILNNIGFTGIDNGLITGLTVNDITGSTLIRITGDTRLILNKVTGNTGEYIYPVELIQESGDNYIELNGGFYQGFFKSGDEYSILPDKINSEITFEVVLKPASPSIVLPNTLNAKYPENKGFFLYLGARSENKFWYDYYKEDTNKYEISKTGQTSSISSGLTLTTSDGYGLNSQDIIEIETDNKYLLFNRTRDGYTPDSFDENATYYVTNKNKENVNLYLTFNRTSTGYSANNIDDVPGMYTPYDISQDLSLNSIGFRLKEDSETGNTYSIGYRTINEICVDNETGRTNEIFIDEEYSASGITITGISYISVRIIFNSEDSCSNGNRKFKILFYINGKLVFISKELPEIILKNLNDTNEKQEGVPYNISLGGGSQGLCDMIGFNDNYSTQYLLPIEKNFAGTFIGNIYKLKIYNGKMDYTKINNNYIYSNNFRPLHIVPTIIFNVKNMNITLPETIYKREIGKNISYLDLMIILNQDRFPLTNYSLYCSKNNGIQELIIENTLNPSGGVVFNNYMHDASLSGTTISKIEYSVIVSDTYSEEEYANRKIINIEFDNMIFYGVANTAPINSNDIRNLTGKTFNNETNIIGFHTGSINRIFVFAIPANRQIVSAIDKGAWSLDISSALNEPFIMDIMDAGNNPTPYNIYVLDNAIPYSTDHEIIITLN